MISQSPTNCTPTHNDSKVSSTKEAICLSLSRTAGMKWKQDELTSSDSGLSNIASSLLKYQNKSWNSLLTHFKNITNDALDIPDNNTIWAFHLSGLTEATMGFIQSMFSEKTNNESMLTPEKMNALRNLLQNKKRVTSLAIEMIVWQRKLCEGFCTKDTQPHAKPATVSNKRKLDITQTPNETNVKHQKKATKQQSARKIKKAKCNEQNA